MDALPFRPEIQPWPEDFAPPPVLQPIKVEVDQWISSARCSTQYGRLYAGQEQWTASCIAGPPRVTLYGDNPRAWAPANPGTTNEWVELEIEKPCQVRRIKIHESFTPGALERISLWDGDRFVVVHEQEPRCGQLPNQMRIEDVEITAEVITKKIKLDINQQGGNSWYEIDAVQVSGYDKSKEIAKEEPLPNIATAIASLKGDTKTADCTLIVSGGDHETHTIPVHRGILVGRSPFFRALLDRGELPLGGEARLSDMAPKLIELLLQWIYTGHISEIEPGDCVSLLVIADYFQVDDLAEHCADIFRRVLTVDNAALLYRYYHSIGIALLQQASLAFCAENFLAVSKTPAFKELSQSQLLAVIESYNELTTNDENIGTKSALK